MGIKLDSLLAWSSLELLYGTDYSPEEMRKTLGNVTKWKCIRDSGAYFRRPSDKEMTNYFLAADKGTLAANRGISWCGVFQLYLLKKAGVACRWSQEIVDLSGGRDLEIVHGAAAQKDLRRGDIVRLGGKEQHHLMIWTPTESGMLLGLEGNAGGVNNRVIAAYWKANGKMNQVTNIEHRYRVIS